MSKVNVLFFAADPQSAAGGQRLLLDKEVREIRSAVEAAAHRDRLAFDSRWAARPRDLLHALNSTRPRVVHFSGHGGDDGLVLVSPDGERPHAVGGDALAELLQGFRADVRVVVLNACFSLPQARAVAEVVGCAIGTRAEISDAAAITFSVAFYSALAFGASVQAAYDQARAALRLEHVEESAYPELVVRPGVDAAGLVLVRPRPASAPSAVVARAPGTAVRWGMVASVTLALSSGAALGTALVIRDAGGGTPPGIVRRIEDSLTGAPAGGPKVHADSAAGGPVRSFGKSRPAPVPAGSAPVDAAGMGTDMAAARALYEAGNHAAAFPLFVRAAQADDGEAMGYLGMMYLRGEGTERWPDAAIMWLRRAAEGRDARGMNALGAAYERGDGVNRSYRWARHWYQAAVREKGYPPAMLNLGNLYRQGLGVEQSDSIALAWYRKAAHAGLAEAMVDVGLMYEEGLGTARNVDQAVRWYRRAADAGSRRGMFAMGRIYQDAVGVPRDYAQAMSWYRRAAEAGSADAMNNLGVLYHHGWGVRADRAAALRWFRQATAAGSTIAAGNLAALGAG